MALNLLKLPPNPAPLPAVVPYTTVIEDDTSATVKMDINVGSGTVTGFITDTVNWLQYEDFGNADEYTFRIDNPLEDGLGYYIPALNSGILNTDSSLVRKFRIVYTSYILSNGILTADATKTDNDNDEFYFAVNTSRKFKQDIGLMPYTLGTYETLLNGGFGSNLDGWTDESQVNGVWNWSSVASGSAVGNVTGTTFPGDTAILTQILPACPNTEYNVEFTIASVTGLSTDRIDVTIENATRQSGTQTVTVANGTGTYSAVWLTGNDTSEVVMNMTVTSSLGGTVQFIVSNITATVSGTKFMTNSPRNLDIRANENAFLPIYIRGNYRSTDPFSATPYVKITRTQAGGATTTIQQEITNFNNSKRFELGVGPANIDNLSSGFINCDTVSYTVGVYDGDTLISEEMTYTLKPVARDGLRVYWTNYFGGNDAYTFELSYTQSIRTETQTFEKFQGEFPSQTSHKLTTLKTEGNGIITAYSDVVTSEVGEWLRELLTSPNVYLEIDGEYCPVTVRDGSFTTETTSPNYVRMNVSFDLSNNTETLRR